MAKLYFRYGTMNSSKTAQLIMTAYNYHERGQRVLVFKPLIDKRDSDSFLIKSRSGISASCMPFDDKFNFFSSVECSNKTSKINCILVDEAQFLTKEQVINLSDIVDKLYLPVICFGLRTNFKGELFDGSKWLMAYSDEINEVRTICHCGRKATFVARVINGKKIEEGEEIQIGGNELYVSLCRLHWKNAEIGTRGAI